MDEDEKKLRADIAKKLNKNVVFPKCVYSYIKGRCAKEAALEASKYTNKYDMFFKCDIENFFETIDLNILLSRINKIIYDKKLCKDIQNILVYEKTELHISGISLGSPLSPVLSNIYLLDFDNYWITNSSYKYLRFCDDMIFFSNDININCIKDKLAGISLKLSDRKSLFGTKGMTVKFLGFNLNTNGINVPDGKENSLSKCAENNGYYYNNTSKKYDLITLINAVNSGNNDKFLKILENFDTKGMSKYLIDKLISQINNKFGKAYECLFRYLFNSEDKDGLLNELTENEDYNSAYIFEELISKIVIQNKEYENYLKLFKGRECEYYISDMSCRKEYIKKAGEIDEKLLKSHFDGNISLGIRLDRIDSTSMILVFDIDSSDMVEALDFAKEIKKKLNKKGYNVYIEFSGMKGYHVWIFFGEYIQIAKLEVLAQSVTENMHSQKTKIEIKPCTNYITETQNVIKLPLGNHPETKAKSLFLDIDDVNDIKINKGLIDLNITGDFTNEIKDMFPESYKILINCCILRQIIEVAIAKKNMCHFERLLLLYVFSYIEKGRDFIHYTLSKMNNYSFSITEKFLNKAPERPISCRKIRDYYKDSEIVTDCACKFDLKDGMYPSPVIYSNESEFSKISIESRIRDMVVYANLKIGHMSIEN